MKKDGVKMCKRKALKLSSVIFIFFDKKFNFFDFWCRVKRRNPVINVSEPDTKDIPRYLSSLT
jgi:hypothetical protein